MSGLKPCPFCGRIALLVERPNPMSKWRWSVDCQSSTCGMSGPVEASKADAITAWNARAEATTGADALVGQKIDRALVVAMEDFINEPRRGGPYPEPMDTRDYRAEAYRVWTPLCRAILSAIDEGRG